MFSHWVRYYFVLDDGALKYYKSDSEADMLVPEGVFNMDHYYLKLCALDELLNEAFTLEECTSGIYFGLRIHGLDNELFLFQAETKDLATQWQ